jgi:lipopolysaccharide/colanic/teichoic acid biosynthesis glycosyltransferase
MGNRNPKHEIRISDLAMKRLFDLVCCCVAVIVLLPLLAVIAIAVKLSSRGPVLFVQERVGRGGRKFKLLKFRSMVLDAHMLGPQITHGRDPRITSVGRWLRRTKLDELPQLLNVIKGDMSIVGPRPEVPRYVALYNEEQRQVLSVRPGLTDLATLAYRDEESLLQTAADPEMFYVKEVMPAKLRLNREYLEKRSFLFDLRLIGLTLWRVVRPLSARTRVDTKP